MLSTTTPPPSWITAAATALVGAYIATRGDALALAAERLGGQPAVARLSRLRDGVTAGHLSPSRTAGELRHVLALLMLDHVADPDRDEAGFFAMIDPASHEVHKMCLLAEEVARLLRDVRRLASHPGAAASASLAMRKSHEADSNPTLDADSDPEERAAA